MNEEPNTTPPAPDPFEALAATLAQCAAMLVQCAGQITQLKSAQQQPPAPTPEEPKPEEQPEQSEGEASEQEQASDEQPTHEDGRAGEKEGEPSEQDADSAEQPQPDADDLTESEQDGGQGEELDEQPPAEAEPQPADSAEGEGEGEQQDQEQSEDAPSAPADAQDSDSEGQSEAGQSEADTEASEDAQSSPQQAEASSSEQDEQDEQDEQEDAEDSEKPTPTFDEGDHSAHGDGDSTEKPEGEAADDSKGTAAMLPPDLPPIDPSLAKCSPPPPPSATPYRPLTPVAKKVADILTNALGKAFAIPRPDRHTGTLNSAAIARHAPDVFKRRPRQDGKRPKLTVLVDTSGSMSAVRELYGLDLIDGLLEAHRRKVINLRLYDAYLAKIQQGDFSCDETGMFHESRIKEGLSIKPEIGKTSTDDMSTDDMSTDDMSKYRQALNLARNGAMEANGEYEGFAEALQNLLPVIKDSDATILFTDGHWTDGCLDKVHYQQNGVQVVGLYIDPATNQIQDFLLKLSALVNSIADEPARTNAQKKVATYHAKLALLSSAARAANAKMMEQKLAYFLAKQGGKAVDEKTARRIAAESEDLSLKMQIALRAVQTLESEFYALAKQAGLKERRAFDATLREMEHVFPSYRAYQSAASAAQLAYNSHRSYAMPDAITAAQAIVQEITKQIAAQ